MCWLRCHKTIVGLGFVLLLLGLTAAPPAGADVRARASGPVAAPESRAWAAARTFKGRAFDTCRAPSADTMRRWRASPYRAVGVYFGGRGRACRSQPHLSSRWMRTVEGQGWRVLPLYVGSQATCVFAKNKKNVRIGRHPWKQGTAEGRDAVKRAAALGIRPGSPLFLDMEAYAHGKKQCARTTLLFVRGWDREVARRGYLAGFYSSAESGIRHMERSRRAGVRDLPSVVWFARWGARSGLYSEPVLRKTAWMPARRIHQYAGNVRERHGGRTLLIDRNQMHAPVARIG
ncbi:glycoside hydrolase domain-containing protein [Streptomyces beigongshangae]|uniref:glycoside hydrolase domain-containing protein n=1 Tax=Streptomyces beigongshangae TaxID=2841597 RepID=UPI001C85188E|nr:glycoside hydrolase domain-containing protein [Streptomyces sp. REN17]